MAAPLWQLDFSSEGCHDKDIIPDFPDPPTSASATPAGSYTAEMLKEILPDLIGQALQGFEDRHLRALEEHTQTLLASLQACSNMTGEHSAGGVDPTDNNAPLQGSPAGPLTPNDSVLVIDIDDPAAGIRRAQHSFGENSSGYAVSESAAEEQGSEDQNVATSVEGHVEWQWLASSGRWKAYDTTSIERVEAAYRRGESKVLLRSGKTGKMPMELFLFDMLQHDPESNRNRVIRRQGAPLTCWQSAKRHSRAWWRALASGRLPYESCEEHMARASVNMQVQRLDTCDSVVASSFSYSKSMASIRNLRMKVRSAMNESHTSSLQKFSNSLVHSSLFNFVGSLVVLLQCWWIWRSTDLNFGIQLYDQDVKSIILEHFFLVYFTLDFAARIFALKHRCMWYRHRWLRLDFVCAVSSWVDVLVLPPLSKFLGVPAWTSVGGDVLRVIRLLKLFRLSKAFGSSQEFNTIIKGTISGMVSAGYVVVLLAMAVFFFAVLLRAHADHDALRDHFGTLNQAMVTLLTRGLFLDDVGMLVQALLEAEMITPILIFSCFMYISFFGLLSMLIGAFCNVADETANKEHDKKKLYELNRELEDIAWCYMEEKDDGRKMMTHRNFRLFVRNPDVQKKFHDCQVDDAGVETFVTAWFKTRKENEIEFVELLALIAHMREGRPSFTSDIAGLQGFVMQSFNRLERSIMASARPGSL